MGANSAWFGDHQLNKVAVLTTYDILSSRLLKTAGDKLVFRITVTPEMPWTGNRIQSRSWLRTRLRFTLSTNNSQYVTDPLKPRTVAMDLMDAEPMVRGERMMILSTSQS